MAGVRPEEAVAVRMQDRMVKEQVVAWSEQQAEEEVLLKVGELRSEAEEEEDSFQSWEQCLPWVLLLALCSFRLLLPSDLARRLHRWVFLPFQKEEVLRCRRAQVLLLPQALLARLVEADFPLDVLLVVHLVVEFLPRSALVLPALV